MSWLRFATWSAKSYPSLNKPPDTIVDFKKAVKLELAHASLNNPEYTAEKVAFRDFAACHPRRIRREQTGETILRSVVVGTIDEP